MYSFTDTIERAGEALLPSEALQINGEYIENQIPGYRTLYVSGREVMESELIQDEVGISDGARFRRKRYPPRTITVGYMLKAESNAAFREAYNKLNAILGTDEAKLIFADEPDKYFVGTKQKGNDVPTGVNCVTGEIEFFCADPFKYTIEEKTVIPTLDDGRTFVIDYQGTGKCFPKLQAHAKADLGFVGFINQDEKIIQLGDIDEVDEEHYEVSQVLIDDFFDSYNENEWVLNSANTVKVSSEHKQIGEVAIVRDKTGAFITGFEYGSGTGWHGPSITKQIPADNAGKAGAKNCTFSWHHIYDLESYISLGVVQFLMTGKKEDNTKRNVAAVTFFKNHQGSTKAYAHMYINGVVKKEISFEGLGNKLTNYPKGRSSIMKFGSRFTFNLFGQVYEFTVPEMEDVETTEISIYIGANQSYPKIALNGVYSVQFVKHGVDAWRDIPNKFYRNDLIIADCRSGKVTVNDVEMPGLGALGNDWEGFYLVQGINQIQCTYSNWAVTPEFTIKYREVYL